MQEFRLYKSPWKAVRMMALCAGFVALGWFDLNYTDAPRWVGWACMGFFGLGVVAGLMQLFDRRPQIIVNDVGVFDRMMHHEFINWEIIRDVYPAEVHRQPFICLVVDAAFEPSRRKGKLQQSLAGINKELGFQELNIPLGYVRVDALRFAAFIQAVRGSTPPERAELVRKAIANL